ncbi:MAG: SRPBCC family protein [Candidatus Limnocylindria bacterium]
MGHVLQSGHIEAPPDKAFAMAIDATRIAEWNSSVVETRDITGSLDRVGASYIAILKLGGRRLEGHWEVSKVEKPRLLEITGTAPGGGRATATNRFEPAGAGTDVTIEIDYDFPGGFVGGMADKLFVERAIDRDVKHSVENFKEICEAEVRVPA